jgi:hypothetical protein
VGLLVSTRMYLLGTELGVVVLTPSSSRLEVNHGTA